jgi:hypothetical protein
MKLGVGQALFGDLNSEADIVFAPLQVHDLIVALTDGFNDLDFFGHGSADADLVSSIEELQQPLDFLPVEFRHSSPFSV